MLLNSVTLLKLFPSNRCTINLQKIQTEKSVDNWNTKRSTKMIETNKIVVIITVL